MKKSFLIFLLLLSIINACSLFENETFKGDWNLKLEGDYTGNMVFTIDDDNQLKGSALVSLNGYDYEILYTGEVEEAGDVFANIESQGQMVGEITGKIDFIKGTGKWTAANMKGNWTANKIEK